MKSILPGKQRPFAAALLLAFSAGPLLHPAANSGQLALATVPLFLTSGVLPNVLVIYDNSQSMDSTMAGRLIAGNDAATRSNIGRQVIRDTISNYRTTFNWGLMSYGMSSNPPTKYNTYAYYLGSDSGMVFTNDCVSGISATNGGRRCVANPQAFSGGNYVTYDKTGDDPDINDVLYDNSGPYTALWGLTPGTGTSYKVYTTHSTAAGNSWATSAFSGSQGTWAFTPTDAGYLPANPPITRQLYLPRAWGYLSNITGTGTLNEPVQADSTTHFNSLIAKLAAETGTSSSEIKNGAVFTPLKGTLDSARTYFSSSYQSQLSPIAYSCQKNFVMMVTDGLPTGTSSGTLYTSAQRTNTFNPASGTWAFGTAAQDAINSVNALRSTNKGGTAFDVQTYMVALSDTVANAEAMAVMNALANAGGTGTAYLATDQTSFQAAIQNVANDIISKTGAASTVSLNTGTWSTNAFIYQAKFSSGDWSGQLLALPIQSNGTIGAPSWDAGQKVNTQNYDSGRKIITYKPSGSTGIPFRWPVNSASPTSIELDSVQIVALNKNASGVTDGQGGARLDFLRGSSSNEGSGNGYRVRPNSKLGDLIHSAPYYVAAPPFNYPSSFESASYPNFVSSYMNRTPMIYIGGNDGMLHGFDAGSGEEKLAYVPAAVYNNLSQLTSPSYSHRYFVDGSPTVGDAFYAGTWHSVLLGGLSGGGQGFFALDVTNPAAFSENNAAGIVRWEFTDSSDADTDATMRYALGYSFSQPSLVKMANGKWAAVFGNGYNNTEADGHASTSGYAVLYILDVETGAVLTKINTKSGSATTPNGLATPIPVDTNGDGVTDYIYAGDLLGNIWKFDVTGTSPSQWKVAFGNAANPAPLFTAKDAANTPQPVTTRLEVGKHPVSGVMVYFGTGKYLETTDNSTTSPQAFYAVWDDDVQVSGRGALLQQSVTGVSGDYRMTSNNIIDWGTHKGWYLDLPTGGERQVTESQLRNGKIIFTTMIPETTACSYGGSGWLMEMDALSGGHPLDPVLDVNGDGKIDLADVIAFGGSNVPPSGKKMSGIPSAPGILGGAGGSSTSNLENKYLNLSSGTIEKILESAGPSGSGRVSWKQIQ
ncbi:pilus assembly protein [Sulfuricella sp.]|uniref:pilus assembly protein n=1 Tax=Sulfuricella sp. TaxID=2099377 RepID=UPI002B8A8F71|nr:PilC/PilY family type IV pilus protein [Sulfuricella sp.]HUX64516.1 PilC/PilY family type IV pilus protein [Sulfuricella sp.]